MPRKGYGSKVGHGGPRVSQPGVAHGNRTDLNGTQPIRTAPGQPYGSAKQQEQAQQVVPLPQAGDPAMGPSLAPTQAPVPGMLTPLGAPTGRPDEPITHGIDSGPGSNSSVLFSSPKRYGAQVLEHLAGSTGDPFLNEIARRARNQVV